MKVFQEVRLAEEVIDEISITIQKTDQCEVSISEGIRELWFRGSNETELRLLFLGTYRLTVSRVAFQNQKTGAMTQVIDLLVDFCKKQEIQQIVIQSVETEAMSNFCRKYGFHPNPNASFQYGDLILGDYVLDVCPEM